jgi:hypothetical protein
MQADSSRHWSNANREEKQMQATINVSQNKIEYKGTNDCRVFAHLKRVGGQTFRLASVALVCLLIVISGETANSQMPMPQQTNTAAQSDAQKAFEKLKTLAGTWQGTLMGMPINLTMRVTSSGNAILHEATSSGRPDDPITMFYVEGDRLLATHYCDTGNRPRMEGKLSPDGKTLEFNLVDIIGNTRNGYMGHIVFTFVDASHHTEGGSWMFPGNKPAFQIPRLEYTRAK